MPRKILPMISIQRYGAEALKTAPRRKNVDATRIVGFLPNLVQTLDAAKLEERAARYSEEVKS